MSSLTIWDQALPSSWRYADPNSFGWLILMYVPGPSHRNFGDLKMILNPEFFESWWLDRLLQYLFHLPGFPRSQTQYQRCLKQNSTAVWIQRPPWKFSVVSVKRLLGKGKLRVKGERCPWGSVCNKQSVWNKTGAQVVCGFSDLGEDRLSFLLPDFNTKGLCQRESYGDKCIQTGQKEEKICQHGSLQSRITTGQNHSKVKEEAVFS